MSFSKIKELNNHFIEKYGYGIEEIVVESPIFTNLLLDCAASRMFDNQFPDTIEDATNIKFEGIVITRSVRNRIKETEEEIKKLQEKLNTLKTRTGF